MDIFIVILFVINFHCIVGLNVTIKTRLGTTITGSQRKSRDGNTYYAFTRIPYAKAPVGKLRLKNPVEIELWEGNFDATQTPPKCLQLDKNCTTGQEDCLFLNIYTPQLPTNNNTIPVLVYIFGGGFRQGYVGEKNEADYFMDENTILVTFNYRVGILGFLSTEDSVIPGNFGLKDQAMAINWVYKNIDIFGGDPAKLTVFGGSSGAACTHYQMMSPLTKNVIKGGISQSGVVNRFWALSQPGESRKHARKLAQIVGCSHQLTELELLRCLQLIPAQQLVKSEVQFIDKFFEPSLTFLPVQEPEIEGAFMPFNPLTEITSLPWITGIVNDDGLLIFGTAVMQDDSVTKLFIKNIDTFLLKILYLDKMWSNAYSNTILNRIKAKYFPQPITIQTARRGLLQVYRDCMFIYTMASAINRHNGPLFQYHYDYRGANSFMDRQGNFLFGTAHGDEIIALLNWSDRFPRYDSEDVQYSKYLVKMWANFAKTQNPSLEEIRWPDNRNNDEYLHFARPISIKRHLAKNITSWWLNLLE